ncbi:hypothetical protein A0H76_2314 [Hepatospora eriocheir]|uniref:Uncharacterized protein n=1 Tax=Hepatospora eriocheir TaxID=1081669 RepID=A0A1X0QFN0_9MICR|nr:hypothetical protein A0H76_2314 [Hepatospora eriocheir]
MFVFIENRTNEIFSRLYEGLKKKVDGLIIDKLKNTQVYYSMLKKHENSSAELVKCLTGLENVLRISFAFKFIFDDKNDIITRFFNRMKNEKVSLFAGHLLREMLKTINPLINHDQALILFDDIASNVSKCIEILKKEFGEDKIQKIEEITKVFLWEIVLNVIKNIDIVLLFDPLNNLSHRNTEYYDLILSYLKEEKILTEDDGSDVYIILKEACKHSKDEFIDSVKILRLLFDLHNFLLINTEFNIWDMDMILEMFNEDEKD